MNSWPIDVAVIFVLGSSDQVKITTHHHWVLASRDLVLKLFKKCRSSSMVSWTINPHIFENYLRSSMQNHCTDEKLALVNRANFKHAISESKQQSP
jgi:hypothetical protein